MADPKAAQAKSTLDRPAQSVGEMRQLFARPDVIEQIKLTLPQHMSPERLSKIMLSTVLKTPDLMKVNMLSLIQILTQLSELGLEPGSYWGHVYLIPFENKAKHRYDVNIIIGYKGLLELSRRSGFVSQIETHIVFEDEIFELEYGFSSTKKFRHVPNLKAPRDEKKAYAVYLLARLKDGSEHFEIMPMDEVRKIRDAAPSSKGKSSPWGPHFLQMARKTIIRRAANYLPLSAEMVAAMELEDGSTIEGSIVKPSLQAVSAAAADDLAGQMANSRAQDAAEPEDAETVPPHDPVTGEVQEQPQGEQQEPDLGTIDHLIWRINKAAAGDMEALKKEAFALDKNEARRLEVSAAIKERSRTLQVQP